MRPKDLELPFGWDNQQIVIHERILYIPPLHSQSEAQNIHDFIFPKWDSPEVFGNQNPIVIEYCSGNGAWIAEKARIHPEINWVAVEMKYERVRKIWSKAHNHNLSNLFIICAEALLATKRFILNKSIQSIYINFPDPWPKKKHAKNRLIQAEFIQEMDRILHDDGHVMLATDDSAYSDWTIDTFKKTPSFQSFYDAPFYTTEIPNYGSSYFEELWREKGKEIRYHHFIKY